jgi:hypothetical protein
MTSKALSLPTKAAELEEALDFGAGLVDQPRSNPTAP